MTLRAVAQPAVNASTAPTTGAGFINSIRSVSTSTNALSSDYTLLVTNSTDVTITLPSSNVGRVYNIKKIGSTANTVTVVGAGAATIDGAASVVLTNQYQVVTLQFSGSNWFVL